MKKAREKRVELKLKAGDYTVNSLRYAPYGDEGHLWWFQVRREDLIFETSYVGAIPIKGKEKPTKRDLAESILMEAIDVALKFGLNRKQIEKFAVSFLDGKQQ